MYLKRQFGKYRSVEKTTFLRSENFCYTMTRESFFSLKRCGS